ncbi:MAG: HAD-IIB family hydrolase [Clostridia bacterium]|nr:HAD-IIB family hydrolase [Clostridia bacterium]
MSKTGYALFFDIDGTLYFDGKISEENVRELNRVRENGNMIFINTGRSYGYCPPELVGGEVLWSGFVCGSSYVYANGRVLCDKRLSRECVGKVIDFCIERCLCAVLEGVDNAYFIIPDGADDSFFTKTSFKKGAAETVRDNFDSFLRSEAAEKITKISFLTPLSPEDVSGFDELWFIHFDTYTEGILRGYTKASGISVIEKELAVPHEKTVAFGDSANDIEALDYAHTSVLVMHGGSAMTNYPATEKITGEPTTAIARYLKENF